MTTSVDGAVRRDAQRGRRGARADRLAVAMVLCAAAVHAVGSQWVWPHDPVSIWMSTALQLVAPAIGGGLAVRRGLQLSGRARQAWLLLGSGACSWSGGAAVYDAYENVLGTAVPFPGPPDAGFLLAVVLLAAGVWRYPTLPRRRWSVVRSGIDSLLVVLSTLLTGWVLVIGAVFASEGVDWPTRLVATAYPCGDVLVIGVLVLLLRNTPLGGRDPLVILLTGMLMLVSADTAYALLSASDSYYTGHPADAGWWAGLLLVGFAARSYDGDDEIPLDERRLRGPAVFVPYVTALTGLAAVGVHWWTGNPPTVFEATLVAAVVLLLLARQSMIALESVAMARELRDQAYEDALTGLPNRRSLHEQLGTHLERGRGVDAVLFLDLDGFKEINDTLGHEAGDELLREAARRLQSSVREQDVVARLGGDEFAVVLLVGSDPPAVARRLLRRMREPFELAGTAVTVTTSIGIAPALSGPTGDDLLRNADTAMYHAKGAGRDQVVAYRPELHDRARERLDLAVALREAVENGGFTLHYQPLVELATGRIRGVEALVCWQRDGRLVPPADFLPAAEATGLIIPLGGWILDQACADLAAWHRAGHPDLHVAVDVAARQLSSAAYAAQVTATLERHGLAPGSLTLEITENVVLDDDPGIRTVLDGLAATGVRLSLDDFGTGYASLSTLRSLPVSSIKVDRSFIEELETGESPIVDAIAYLAGRFGLTAVAEGVETIRQRDRLRDAGIAFAQGYLFSPPCSAAEIVAQLREHASLSRGPR